MNRNMVMAEWSRAREALRAAETLTRNRCYADGISRAYYAILHAAKAALQVHNVAAESHAAVRRMFGLHLIAQERSNRNGPPTWWKASMIGWRRTTTLKPFSQKKTRETNVVGAASFLAASGVIC